MKTNNTTPILMGIYIFTLLIAGVIEVHATAGEGAAWDVDAVTVDDDGKESRSKLVLIERGLYETWSSSSERYYLRACLYVGNELDHETIAVGGEQYYAGVCEVYRNDTKPNEVGLPDLAPADYEKRFLCARFTNKASGVRYFLTLSEGRELALWRRAPHEGVRLIEGAPLASSLESIKQSLFLSLPRKYRKLLLGKTHRSASVAQERKSGRGRCEELVPMFGAALFGTVAVVGPLVYLLWPLIHTQELQEL